MINAVTLKSDGSTSNLESIPTISLDAPSVVTLGIGPEQVARFDKVGNDLVLLLKDGTKVTITGFFVMYDEGRNDVVFIDGNDVVWWAQYEEPWHCFYIAEIEQELVPAVFAIPGLAPILGALAGIGLIGGALGGSGGDDAPVAEPNVPPVAGNDVALVIEAGVNEGGNETQAGTPQATGNVLENDVDAGADALTVIGVQIGDTQGAIDEELQGAFGALVLNSDGTYSYVLDNGLPATQALGAGDTATEVFSYTVSDGNGGTDTATLTITVQGTNDVPVIDGMDAGAVQEDGDLTATGQLTASDVDEGDRHTWSINGDTAGQYGNFGVNGAGEWTYLLDDNLGAVQALGVGDTLTDTILVRATDSVGGWTEQLVTVTITGSNDAPVINAAVSDFAGLVTEVTDNAPTENAQTLTATGVIAYTDADVGDAAPTATVAPVSDDGSYVGEITLAPAADGTIGWTFEVDDTVLDSLPAGEILTQVYEIAITDEQGATVTQTVTITVVGSNDAPVPQDDVSLIGAGQTAVLNVLANDSDVDTGDTANLTVTAVDGQPISEGNPVTLSDGSGTVSIDCNGVLSFEPAPGFTGPVSIPYTVDDGSGTDNPSAVGAWVVTVVDAVISDNAGATPQDPIDDVLASVDDLEAVVISGQTAVAGTLTEVTITDGTNTVTVPLDAVTINPDGTYTLPADVSDLLDGTLTVSVTQTDPSGNTATTTDTILLDTTTAVAIDPVTIVDGEIPTITGTGQPGDTVAITLDGIGAVEVQVADDGTWSYTPDSPLSTPEVTISVTATDPYGNTATDVRQVAGLPAQTITVSESGLPFGTDPTSGANSTQDTLSIGTNDGDITQITIANTVLTVDQLNNIGTTPIAPIDTDLGTLTVTGFDPATGTITYVYDTNNNSLDNENSENTPSERDLLTETIQITVTDGDGDTRVSTLEVAVSDDIPVVVINPSSTAGLTASEGAFGTNPSQSFADIFDVNTGADGTAVENAIVFELQVPIVGVASGLIDTATGESINLYLENGIVVGRVGPADGPVVVTVSVDPATGVVTLDQQRPVVHPDGSGVDEITFTNSAISLGVTVTDGDGDIVVQQAPIGDRLILADDLPVAVDDVDSLAAGDNGPASGNLITGAGTDTPSADGGQITSVTGDGAATTVPATGDIVVQGLYGTLTVSADGSYSYTRDPNTPGGVDDVFDYTLTDDDGDTSDAQLTVSLGDSGVSITELTDDGLVTDIVVNEAHLPTGTNPAGTDETASGSFTITSFDGIDALTIAADGVTLTVIEDSTLAAGPLVLTSALGSTLTITGYDPTTGEVSYTYDLVDGDPHAAGTVDLLDVFDITLTDLDGDTVSDVLNVRIIDDAPVITAGASALVLAASDVNPGVNPSADLSTLFVLDHGADGADAAAGTVYSLETPAPGTDSGIIDTASGLPVVLFEENGVLVGRVGDQNGAASFTVSVDAATGVVTLDQILPVQHPVADAADVVSVLDAAVVLRVTALDADGDSATQTAPIGARLSFADDVPVTALAVDGGFAVPVLGTQDADTLAGPDTATADFSGAIALTNDLGNDGAAATDGEVLSFAIGLTGGAASVASGLSSEGNAVTLFVDANGVIVGSTAADLDLVTAVNTVFRIACDAAGQVTLTQVQPIDHDDDMDATEVAALAADLIVLTATSDVEDADGDTAQAVQTLDIGASFTFTDDGPTAGTTPDAAVDEDGLRNAGGPLTATGDIIADLGADRESAPAGVTFDAAQTALVALGLTSDGVALVYTVTDGLVTATVGAGGPTAFTAALTQPDAANVYTPSYTYTQNLPLDHPAAGPDDITLPFAITVTDADSDTATSTLNVVVTDDVPTATGEVTLSVVEGATALGTDNGNPNLLANDAEGADGSVLHQVRYVDDAGATQIVALVGGTTGPINVQYGQLSVDADGSWSFEPDAAATHTNGAPLDATFSYTLIDADGDVTAFVDQPINVTDTAPVAADDAAVTIAEGAASATGNVITNDTASADGGTLINSFSYTDDNGDPLTFTFVDGGPTFGAVDTPTGELTVNIDGSWTFAQSPTFDHDEIGANQSAGSFTYVLVDADGSLSGDATQVITVTDTDPVSTAASFGLDEADLPGGSNGETTDPTITETLAIVKGPDDIANVVFNAATIAGLPALTSDGTSLVYTVSLDGHTLTATIGTGPDVAFTLVINIPTDATGAGQSITATLSAPIDQVGATLSLLNVSYEVQDIDSAIEGTAVFVITDDTPLTPQNDTPVTVVEDGAAVGSANGGVNLLANDVLGADDGLVYDITYTDRNGITQTALVTDPGTPVNTQYGVLTVGQDGVWTYTPIPTADHVRPTNDLELSDDFTYRTIDGDGDISGASGTQEITVTDTVATIGTTTDVTVNEANLALGSDPDAPELAQSGTFDLVAGEDTFDTTITGLPTGLTSRGVDLEYVTSVDGHTVTAYRGTGGTAADEVFNVALTNPTAANAGYTFTLIGPIDQGTDPSTTFSFGVTVTDSDGDTDQDTFDITVLDDQPTDPVVISLPEDTTSQPIATSADATTDNVVITQNGGTPSFVQVGNTRVYTLVNGSVTVLENGSLVYEPNENFSGEEVFEFEVADGGGENPRTVTATVTPVSDAPTVTVAATTINTLEDTAIGLGLVTPVITDTGTPRAERIGLVTLTGLPEGAILTGDGIPANSIVGTAPITIQIDDGNLTLASASGATFTLTPAQYEALSVTPPEHTHEEFTVTASVTSFEVDAAGNALAGIAGATSTASVLVEVQAVTDDVALIFNGAGSIANTASIDYAAGLGTATVTLAEDTIFSLSDILTATFLDLDGSEVRSITITNGPDGPITVGSVTVAAGGEITLSDLAGALGQTGDISSFADIQIGGGPDFSGDLNGIQITINAQDFDSDGFVGGADGAAGLAEDDPNNNTVFLNLAVTPVAGDVEAISPDSAPEDTPIAFLAGVRVTDATGGTGGTELITVVAFDLPTSEWTVTPPPASAVWSVDLTGGTYTITFTGGTQAEREAVLDAFTITPPAHSSLDAEDLTLSITTVDTADINSNSVTTAPLTVDREINIVVTPVAERIDVVTGAGTPTAGDTDGDGVADLTMNPDHVYDVSEGGSEDGWFALDQGSFSLADGWSGQDGDEFDDPSDGLDIANENTYARLVPVITSGPDNGSDAIGSQFRYTDNNGVLQTQTFTGAGVDIPVYALDTVEFLPAPDFAGQIAINVTAYTEDFDDDDEGNGTPDSDESGMAVLTNLVIAPVADAVSLTLTARVNAIEDTRVELMIRPRSSDMSETFNVNIADIPDGARIFVNNVEITVTSGSAQLDDFQRTDTLEILPPPDSNEPFDLAVSAVSVDTIMYTDPDTGVVTLQNISTQSPVLPLRVRVAGVADDALVTATPQTYSEADLDGTGVILFSDLLDVTIQDFDDAAGRPDSETLTVRVSGLPEGFSIAGGSLLSPPSVTGTDRIWALDSDQLDVAQVVVPENASGEVNFVVEAVTTENDGNSNTGDPMPVSFTITPSPEATTTTSAVLVEDVVTTLGFGIVHGNGDTDETITGARIRVGDEEVPGQYTVYLGTGPTATLLSAFGLPIITVAGEQFYELTPAQAASLSAMTANHVDGEFAQTLEIFYEITDQEFATVQEFGTGTTSTPVATDPFQSVEFVLSATPVTDPPDVTITAISGTVPTTTTANLVLNDDANPDRATLTATDTITVTLNTASLDSDNSEHVIRVLITGVPIGVTVEGAQIVGLDSWLLVYNGGSARSLDPTDDLDVVFVVTDQVASGTNISDISMTVQVQDRGDESAPETAVLSDTVIWTLERDFAGSSDDEPPAEIEWAYTGAGATEDVPFTLDTMLTGSVIAAATTTNTLTVQLTGLPEGTVVDGMTATVIDGVLTYTASTTASSTDAQVALNALLMSITITLPEDSNDNNNDIAGVPGFPMTAVVISSVVGGSEVLSEVVEPVIPVTPMVDEAEITIVMGEAGSEGVVTELSDDIPITINITNPADGAAGAIVGGNLYLDIDISNPDPNGGVLTSADGLTTYTPTAVSGVGGIPDGTYYVVTGVTYDTPVDLLFTPTTTGVGSITVEALIENTETGDPDAILSATTVTQDIDVDNNGVVITTAPSFGNEVPNNDEEAVIELQNLTIALNDDDGSEEFISILLTGVPSGFLIVSGANAATAVGAEVSSNAGGSGGLNTWVLPILNGEPPAYVAIQPPQNWSGEITGLELLVTTGETILDEARTVILPLDPITVNPVADGITLASTETFGDENGIVPFNFNASLNDTTDTSVLTALDDYHTETATFQITGLGEFASFYQGTVQRTEGISYDAGVYTLTGLTQEIIDELGFLQAADALISPIGITAFTVDTPTAAGIAAGAVPSAPSSPSSMTTVTLDVTEQLPTSADDTLIWTEGAGDGSAPIDGLDGEDTILIRNGESLTGVELAFGLSNIETLDLGVAGANSVTDLTPEQVLSMTDDDNALTISGSAEDILSLVAAWDFDPVTETFTALAGPDDTPVTLTIDDVGSSLNVMWDDDQDGIV